MGPLILLVIERIHGNQQNGKKENVFWPKKIQFILLQQKIKSHEKDPLFLSPVHLYNMMQQTTFKRSLSKLYKIYGTVKPRASQNAYFVRLCRIFWQIYLTDLSDLSVFLRNQSKRKIRVFLKDFF